MRPFASNSQLFLPMLKCPRGSFWPIRGTHGRQLGDERPNQNHDREGDES
jgi:hypothetical protein